MAVVNDATRTSAETGGKLDRKSTLSLAWVFLIVNYIYCDVISLTDAKYLRELMTGTVGGIEMTRGFLLGASVLMEVPMAMIFLSRVLPYRANRWSNVAAGALMTIVQTLSLFVGEGPTPHYLFFSAIEIAGAALVVWYAWTWPQPEGRRLSS